MKYSAIVVFAFSLMCPVHCAPFSSVEVDLNQLTCDNLVDESQMYADETPQDQQVAGGEPVQLRCSAFGSPQPMITWHKDGHPIQTKVPDNKIEKHMNRFLSTIGSTLNSAVLDIGCVDEHTQGMYTCVMDNGCEQRSYAALVLAHDSSVCPSVSPVQPARIVLWTDTRLEQQNAVAQLMCRAEGMPKPTISWYQMADTDKEDEKIEIHDGQFTKILPSGDLLVRSGFAGGKGGLVFQCSAENSLGVDTKTIVLVDLEDDTEEHQE